MPACTERGRAKELNYLGPSWSCAILVPGDWQLWRELPHQTRHFWWEGLRTEKEASRTSPRQASSSLCDVPGCHSGA